MLKPLLCAFGFLTRLPLPRVAFADSDVARSAAYFSWVGAALAALLWLASLAMAPLGMRVSALLLVVLWAWLTGAFHLDGLADTVDGFSGGRGDRERTLTIMRDSRIGAHGAVAVALALMAKWALLEGVLGEPAHAWLLAPVVARFACTLLLFIFPYARAQGLGTAFAGRVGIRDLAIGALGVATLAFACGGLASLWVALAGVGVSLAVALRARSKLGGLTGDVHGAAIELSELAVLIVAASLST